MDNSFDERGSPTQQESKRFLVSLPLLGIVIKWLGSFAQWTEAEQEEAGIYMDRPGGE